MKTMTLIPTLIVALALLAVACNGNPYLPGEGGNTPVGDVVTPEQVEPEIEYDCIFDNDCPSDWGKIAYCSNTICKQRDLQCPDGLVVEPIHGKECVNPTAYCEDLDDQNACTLDTCNYLEGKAVHTLMSCDDGDASTLDTCNPSTGDCLFSSCLDDNPCTIDYDDGGECVHPALCRDDEVCVEGLCEFRCEGHDECADNNPCTVDECIQGVCQNPTKPCNDEDPTTVDYCDADGQCQNLETDCTGGCNDMDACTTDSCQNGICVNIPMNCGDSTVCAMGACVQAPCQGSADCDDGNPCHTGICEYGQCEYEHTVCETGEACDASTGECVELEGPDCPNGCDDLNPATLDVCEAGVCLHHQPLTCGEGTELYEPTGECVPAQTAADGCYNGLLKCEQFESTGNLVYAICAGDTWFELENCGPITSSACNGGTGCVDTGQ